MTRKAKHSDLRGDQDQSDGFIYNDIDGEEDDGDEATGGGRRKKHKKNRNSEKAFALHEDDYVLPEEQNIRVTRPKLVTPKFKRLKKDQRNKTEGHSPENMMKEEPEGDMDEGNEMSDFIVDGEHTNEALRLKKLNKNRSMMSHGVSSSAMMETDDNSGGVPKQQKKGLANSSGVSLDDNPTCKRKYVQKDTCQVALSCKRSQMRTPLHNQQEMDPYYQEKHNYIPVEEENSCKEKELSNKHFTPRMIVHPRFQNFTADEAIEFLADKEPGESIFHPSSHGSSFLTLSLKISDGVYAHKDVVEGEEEHKDIPSLLHIGEDTFKDLDEVMSRYVDPLAAHLKAMLSYRKFKKGTKAEVVDLLAREKSENTTRVVYSFSISHEQPGMILLTYIRDTNPLHEYIGLYPKGFMFRKIMFEEIDRLVAYFQKLIDDPWVRSDGNPKDGDGSTPCSWAGTTDDSNGGGNGGWGAREKDGGDGGGWGGFGGEISSGWGGGAKDGGRRKITSYHLFPQKQTNVSGTLIVAIKGVGFAMLASDSLATLSGAYRPVTLSRRHIITRRAKSVRMFIMARLDPSR